MLQWLSENIGTIIVTIVIIGVISGIVLKIRNDRKKGKSSCGCNCGQCAMSEVCHKQ